MQELTDEGLNLAGVKKVLALERELAKAKHTINELEQRQHDAIEQVRRENRRDLVPVSQAVTVYRRPRRT